MAGNEQSDHRKLNTDEEESDQTSNRNSSSDDFAYNMKKCSDALKDAFNQDRVNKSDDEKSQEDKVRTDLLDDGENNAEEEVVSGPIEYDDEHMKELHKDKTDEQLEESKEQATTLKSKGNEQYKNGNFTEAIDLYTEALNCCPLQFTTERSILYSNRSAAYIGTDNKKNAVEDCNKALELNPTYMKALVRRAQLHRKMDNLEQSLEDYKKILELDPGNGEARQSCALLPGEIHERNERLKTEMMGKLKDLGNMVLRPFGLSTNNFNMVQDPNTGGYSINFQNNTQ